MNRSQSSIPHAFSLSLRALTLGALAAPAALAGPQANEPRPAGADPASAAPAPVVPVRTWVPVQAGPDGAVRRDTLYVPGRVLVQFTADALGRTDLPSDGRRPTSPVPVGEQRGAVGLAEVDELLLALGLTDVRRALIDTADAAAGAELGLDRWYVADVDPSVDVVRLAARLTLLPDVQEAQPDWRAFTQDVPNDPLHSAHWGHRNTGQMLDYCWGCGEHPNGSPVGTPGFDCNAEQAWDEAQGHGNAGVVIAIIDSGVDVGHPDLRQVAGYDYGDGDSNADDNSAQQGHGTACAGVAAAINGNGLGTAGVAGGSSIMPLKVANSGGGMAFSSVANAIIHSADNGADIASLSLGAAISNESTTSNAINYANGQGVTILAATANSNASTLDFPANHQLVIGVGAASPCGERKRSSSNTGELSPGVSPDPNGYTCDGERWWGSNYGTNTPDAAGAVDVIAPTILPTADVQGSGGYEPGNYSGYFNGTSCATPYAAGVCALIIAANPGFTPAQVRDRLVSTAQDVTSVESGPGWDRYTGYGMVDALAAVAGSGGGGPTVTYASLPYSTGFESDSLDDSWTTVLGAEGRIQVTTANGPFAGSRHLTMDDATSGGAFSQNEARLHLDLSGETNVDLDFRWKEFGDETHSQDGVYFSDDGGSSFSKVANLNGGSTTNNSWSQVSLDLDDLAAGAGLSLNSTFVVKFQQYDNYPISSDGFAFDEISVVAATGGGGSGDYAALPYATGFESGSLDANWSVVLGTEGRVLVTSANGPSSGSYHLTMDDTVNGGAFSQNEARMGLDLSGESQVSLSFRWKEFGDETHAQDGVYFSSNGGSSFTKVHDLNGGSTTNNSWQTVDLDLDALASSAGLALTSTFVVKFQQYDNYGISTDGFAFDDIEVSAGSGGGGNPGFATLPYSTGFEGGSVDTYWQLVEGVQGRILVTTANGPDSGSYHLTMDDDTNGGSFSQNEAWLKLDLSSTSQATLSFRWKHFSDETHSQDGVYVSSNGGTSFTKIWSFNPGSVSAGTWRTATIDLDQAAANAGVALTGSFVVKFQQYDNWGISSDGMAIDSVTVD
ncbi:MAG: S8 family serine peptidase [Planctomycetota bacterium]